MNQMLSAGVPFLFLLFGFFLAAAALSYLLRQWARVGALAGAASALVLALLVWQIDFARPMWVLPTGWVVDFAAPLSVGGYTLQLQAGNAAFVTAGLVIAALALTLAAVVNLDDALPSLVWLLTAGYTAVLLLVAAPLAPVFVVPLALLALAALGAFALQGGHRTDPAGPLRLLFPPLLAAPLFILAAWYLDSVALNPQDVAGTQAAGVLLGLGLLLLLAPFPLHGAVPTGARTAPPPAFLVVMLLNELAVLHLTGQVVTAYPLILRDDGLGAVGGALGVADRGVGRRCGDRRPERRASLGLFCAARLGLHPARRRRARPPRVDADSAPLCPAGHQHVHRRRQPDRIPAGARHPGDAGAARRRARGCRGTARRSCSGDWGWWAFR